MGLTGSLARDFNELGRVPVCSAVVDKRLQRFARYCPAEWFFRCAQKGRTKYLLFCGLRRSGAVSAYPELTSDETTVYGVVVASDSATLEKCGGTPGFCAPIGFIVVAGSDSLLSLLWDVEELPSGRGLFGNMFRILDVAEALRPALAGDIESCDVSTILCLPRDAKVYPTLNVIESGGALVGPLGSGGASASPRLADVCVRPVPDDVYATRWSFRTLVR
jgi:hypothetical protein